MIIIPLAYWLLDFPRMVNKRTDHELTSVFFVSVPAHFFSIIIILFSYCFNMTCQLLSNVSKLLCSSFTRSKRNVMHSYRLLQINS